MRNILFTASLCFMLVPSFCLGQANGFIISEGSPITMRLIGEMQNGNIVVSTMPFVPSNAWDAIYLFDSFGSQLQKFEDRSIFILNIRMHNDNLVIYAIDTPWSDNNSRIIVLDSAFRIIQNIIPVRINWPENYFYPTNHNEFSVWQPMRFFGQFQDTNITTMNRFHSWVTLNTTYDTLTAPNQRFEPINKTGIGVYNYDTSYYQTGQIESVTFPWSTTVNVSVIHQFNDSLQWIKSVNLSNPSIVPNYPRLLESVSLRNLLINDHSVYAFAQHRAASANLLSDVVHSFALYQFDRNLNLKKVAHQLAIQGRRTEISGFTTKTITFDHSGKYLYAIGSHAEPMPLNFNNQDRISAYSIMKYDSALNYIWRKEIELPKTYLHGQTLYGTLDGGVLVAGMRIDSTPNPNVPDVFVVKLDSLGRHSVSVTSLPLTTQIRTYPNPVEDHWMVQWDQGTFESLELFNPQGKLCGSWKTEPYTNILSLQLGNFPPGLYFYHLKGQGTSHAGKVLKK